MNTIRENFESINSELLKMTSCNNRMQYWLDKNAQAQKDFNRMFKSYLIDVLNKADVIQGRKARE